MVDNLRMSSERRPSAPFRKFDKDSHSPSVEPYGNLSKITKKPPILFNPTDVEEVVEKCVKEFMHGKSYDAENAVIWCGELSEILNEAVKDLNLPRYKIVSVVTIGENAGAGTHVGIKTLWDISTDAYANFNYMTDTLFVVGTVFGVYYY